MKQPEIVTVKVQRPLFTNGSMQEVMSYIVDDDDNKLSNAYVTMMNDKKIAKIFGELYKVYYLAEYTEGKPVKLIQPTREDEWV
jgi:hypothetical protein